MELLLLYIGDVNVDYDGDKKAGHFTGHREGVVKRLTPTRALF